MDRRGIEIGGEVARAAGVPEDLDASAAGAYTVPTTRRRRISAIVMLVAAALLVAGAVAGLPAGVLAAAALLALGGVWAWLAAFPLRVGVEEALQIANRESGFPVGHASAAVGFDGWRSRPVWNVLVFSADEPPTQRGLVRIDAVDGRVIGSHVEPAA